MNKIDLLWPNLMTLRNGADQCVCMFEERRRVEGMGMLEVYFLQRAEIFGVYAGRGRCQMVFSK